MDARRVFEIKSGEKNGCYVASAVGFLPCGVESYRKQQRGAEAVLIFNPFDHIDRKEIFKRVAKIKKKKSSFTNEEIARIMIKKKSRWCAAAGGLTDLPGAVPVLGTLVAIIG